MPCWPLDAVRHPAGAPREELHGPWLSIRSRRPFPQVSEGGEAPAVTPTFEGRAFHRPAEDVEDQGAAFDVGTLVSRRNALGIFGAGAGALVLAACGVQEGASSSSGSTSASASSSSPAASSSSAASASPSATLTEMVTENARPYPGGGSNGPDVLDASGIERSDLTTSIDTGTAAEGVPLRVTMNVIDMANGDAAMTGAAVYLWHADAQGRYSMYSDGITEETYLRGVQVVGDDGTVTFTTVWPGCYDGRWPHLHFEVFPDKASITDATNNVLTSQIAMPEEQSAQVYATSAYDGSTENFADVSLETDNVFSDGYETQLPQITGSVEKGFAITIDVPIDTTTEQEQGGMGGPGGGQPPAGGEGGQPPAQP
nr:3,4-dioxygenase subunit beta [Micrococcus luteus]